MNAYTRTENGAIVHASTGHTLLDMNFNALGLRKVPEADIVRLFEKAYSEDGLLAVRWLFYAGDVREGMGERRLFKTILPTVIAKFPHLIKFVGEYNRFDSLLPLLDDDRTAGITLAYIKEAVLADLAKLKEGKSVSLIGKWLPSINTSSQKTRHYAQIISRNLFDDHKTYRKACAALRKAIGIVETKMCKGEWDSIDYPKVPGVAVHRYRKAFNRNDMVRFADFNVQVLKGKEHKNSATVSPAELVYAYISDWCWGGLDKKYSPDVSVEASWSALPDLMKDGKDILPVCDISGSMGNNTIDPKSKIRPIHASVGFSIYCATHNKCEAFKNKVMTFSSHPELVSVSGNSLAQDITLIMRSGNVGFNTNVVAMFERYLNALIANKIPTNAVLPTVVIFSDMEFDYDAPQHMGFSNNDRTLFDGIRAKFKSYGYDLPRMVLWNLCSRTGGAPLRTNDAGLVMISGLNQATMDMVFSDRVDPFEILKEKLNGKRYSQITLD